MIGGNCDRYLRRVNPPTASLTLQNADEQSGHKALLGWSPSATLNSRVEAGDVPTLGVQKSESSTYRNHFTRNKLCI